MSIYLKNMTIRKYNVKKLIARSIKANEGLAMSQFVQSDLMTTVKDLLHIDPNSNSKLIVLNRYYTLDNFADQLKEEHQIDGSGLNNAPRLIIIDTKDFPVSESIDSFKRKPPTFAGISLENTNVFFINDDNSKLVLGDTPKLSEDQLSTNTALELENNSTSVLRLLDNIKSKDLHNDTQIVIRHFHELNNKNKRDITAMIMAKYGVACKEKIYFHEGLFNSEVDTFNRTTNSLVNSHHKTTPIQIIVNSETLKHLQLGLSIKDGKWQASNNLLTSLNNSELLVTKSLSLKEWHELLTSISTVKEACKANSIVLVIQEGISIPEELKEMLKDLKRVERTEILVEHVSDLSYELAKRRFLEIQNAATKSSSSSSEEVRKLRPLTIAVTEDMTLEQLFGHVTLNRENNDANNPIEDSELYKALCDERDHVLLTNLNRNPRLEKQLETLLIESPYVYYLGTRHDFPNANISIMNERRESLDEKIGSLKKKLEQAIQDVLPDPDKYEGFKTDFMSLATKTLKPLAEIGYDHVLDYAYLKKLCRQVLVEQKWDKSEDITSYHLRKAFSTTIKEFKLKDFYKSYKVSIWEDFKKTILNETQKDLRAIIMNMIQEPENSLLMPTTAGGYSQLIQNAVISNDFSSLPDSLQYYISELKEYLDAGYRSKAILARQRIKDSRLELKMKYHKAVLVLGPTGSGKTHQGLRIAKNLDMNVIRANMGPATAPADLMGSLTISQEDSNVIEFMDGKIGEWLTTGGMLLLDEVTMINNWDVFKSYFELGHFISDGKKIVPQENAVIYMTGNESLNGQYGGRHLPKLLRQHTTIVKKPGMSLDDLKTYIIDPLSQRNKKINGEDLSKKLFSIMQLSQELGVPGHSFSTREIQDIVTRFVRQSLNVSEGEIVDEHPNERLFKLCRETLIPLVASEKSADLDVKLRAITDYQGHYDIDLKAQLMERVSLLNQDDPSGLKPGMILNGLASNTKQYLENLNGIDRFHFQTGGQWADLMTDVRTKYDSGEKLIVNNVQLVPTEFWESLINEFMTEPKSGFMLILVSEHQDQMKVSPALNSRFAIMNKNSLKKLETHEELESIKGLQSANEQGDCINISITIGIVAVAICLFLPYLIPLLVQLWESILSRIEELSNERFIEEISFPETNTSSLVKQNVEDFNTGLSWECGIYGEKKSILLSLYLGSIDVVNKWDLVGTTEESLRNFLLRYKHVESSLLKVDSKKQLYEADYTNFKGFAFDTTKEKQMFLDRVQQSIGESAYQALEKRIKSSKSVQSSLEIMKQLYRDHFKYNKERSPVHPNSNPWHNWVDTFLVSRTGLCSHFAQFAVLFLSAMDMDYDLATLSIFPCGQTETHAIVTAKDGGSIITVDVTPSLRLAEGITLNALLDEIENNILLLLFGIIAILTFAYNVHKFQVKAKLLEQRKHNNNVLTPLPKKITLPKIDRNSRYDIELLSNYRVNKVPIIELLALKAKGHRSANRGKIDLNLLVNRSDNPFQQDYIESHLKGVLTDKKLPDSLKKSFRAAGIHCTSYEEVLEKHGVKFLIDEILEEIPRIECEGKDDYHYLSDDDIFSLLYSNPKEIDLSSKHVSIDKVLALKDLEKLWLSNCDLSKITSNQWTILLKNNPNLKKLCLNNCKLNSIPKDAEKLTSLKWLDLSNNKLTNLPETIGKLTSLTVFNLENNLLKTLPKRNREINFLNNVGSIKQPINEPSRTNIFINFLKNVGTR